MKKFLLLAMLAAPPVSAANDGHRHCTQMVLDAYEGLALVRGDVVEVNTFLFGLVRSGQLPIEKKEELDSHLVAAETEITALIDALSDSCASIR